MRLFIASQFSDDYIEDVSKIIDLLNKDFSSSLKIVSPKNIHITYSFLGDILDEKDIPFLKRIIDKFRGLEKINFQSKSIGFFPSPHKPRVIWVDCDEYSSRKLIEIHTLIRKELASNRIYTDDNFKPHITLARVKKLLFNEEIKKISDIKIDLKGSIKNIVLFNSNLMPKGPIYEKIYEVDFV